MSFIIRKLVCFGFLALLTFSSSLSAGTGTLIRARIQPTVKHLSQSMPAGSEELSGFLRSEGSVAEDPLFEEFTVGLWDQWWERYSRALVERAIELKLEGDSLAEILKRVLASHSDTALVPIAALRSQRGEEPVWIIVLRWEYTGQSFPPDTRLRHTRVSAFSATTHALIAEYE